MKYLIFVLLLICNVCSAEIGKVIRVVDGDTFDIILPVEKARIRLACIDAPESKQEYGKEATECLREAIEGESVTLYMTGNDLYGRRIAIVYLNGKDINAYMLSQGCAWHYAKYDKTDNAKYYEALMQEAKENHIGLWKYDNPIAPWEYRRKK